MNGIKPNKEMRKRRDAIIEIGCIVCRKDNRGYVPCTWHHMDGQKTQEKHLLTIGLCVDLDRGHHGPNNNPNSRHNNKFRFERLNGTEVELLEYQNELIQKYNREVGL